MAKQTVYDNWIAFNKNKEGYLNYMYVDVKNLVTTGMGNLIDDGSADPALSLPWRHSDGSLASQDEIQTEWENIKGGGYSQMGGGAQAKYTTLHLNDSDIQSLIVSKLKQMESTIVSRYPNFENWPADAQMGILSMAWAMGPAFNFPNFRAAANLAIPDFLTMAEQSYIPSLGSGDGGRNSDNAKLFTNAANVLADNADTNTLYWPGQVTKTLKKSLIGSLFGIVLGAIGFGGYVWIKGGKL